jgi:mono/diheme cytochrome c family protein
MPEHHDPGSRLSQATRLEARRRDRQVKIALLAVSLLTLLFLAAAALRENIFTAWRFHQREYTRILRTKATDDRGRKLAADFRVEMRQVVLPSLGTIDRCVSCHTGIDDPRMAGEPNPYRSHPGAYLQWHEVNRFGCTICHRGQGRALDFRDAKAEDRHWDYPLLPLDLSESACGLCHSPREVAERGGETFAAGATLFEAKGCRACHKLDGRGGALGPALDNEGLKVRGNLPMAAVQGPHTLPQWLTEHFADPQRIVSGSRMPTPGLSRSETAALTTFLLSRAQRDLPASYLTPGRHLELYSSANPEPASGEQLFGKFCAKCHDTGRRGRYDKFFQMFIPAVRGDTYQQIADPRYVAANIRQGRRGTIMPPWGPAAGGLSERDLLALTSYLLGREIAPEEITPAPAAGIAAAGGSGDPGRGGRLFTKNCSGCHGPAGVGKVAPSLDSPAFLANASEEFLYRTISSGRRDTAMPAFLRPGGLAEGDLRDLVAYIRSLGGGHGPGMAAAAERTE